MGDQCIIFRDQGSIDPLGASILYSLCFDVFSRRYIREALPNVPMFPEIKGRVPLPPPPPPPSKICYIMFSVHNYYLCSSVSIKSWPYFPRSPEINAIFPVPKTPGRASSMLNQIKSEGCKYFILDHNIAYCKET